MINLDEYRLDSIVSSFDDENDYYSIKYKYIDTPVDPHIEFEKTSCFLARCMVTVENKINGESISIPVDLMQVPLITSMGTKIDGTFYEVCSLNARANGWYNLVGKKGMSLELVPLMGRSIKFSENKGIISVKLGSKSKDIALGVYLKAISGLSYKELTKKIGYKNPYIFKSLVNEPNYEECVNIVLNTIIPKTQTNKGYEKIPKELRARELKKIIGPRSIRLSDSSKERYTKTTSFLSRCLDLELAFGVLDYPSGTKLTVPILEKIDSSDIDTLHVIKGTKPFELKKYKIGDENLSIEEICTELNIFINNLSGFEYFDNMFDDLNREILTFEEAIRREVGNKLTYIGDYLNTILISPDLSLQGLTLNNLGKRDLYDFINRCKIEFKHSQGSETTNGASFVGKKSKVIIDYSGKTNEEIIGIKSSQQSAYDLLHIPESLKVGLVSHITMFSDVSPNGMIYSPYLEVKNGYIVSREPVYLSPRDRQNRMIAPWDAKLSNPRVKCYYNDRVITISSKEVEYIEASVFQTISLASALIPFAQFSDGKRVVMGCSQNKQAVPCLASEAPLVSTGALSYDKNASDLVIRAINILTNIYTSNKLDDVADYEDFLKGTIKLIHIDNSKVGYRGYMFSTNYNGKEYKDVTVVPFAKKGTNDTMFHFFLNYKPGMEFAGTDIVLYNNSIDIREYNLVKHINIGNMEVEDVLFDIDTCLGANYMVAYKTSGIPNMDDGICISDEILGTGKLAHVKIVEFKEELKNFKAGVRERFGIDNETSTHNTDGLPKVGTTLKPKSNVVGKTIIKDGIKTIRYSELEMDREGDVVYAEIVGNTAIVGIATIADAEVGDKLAGDHGNKGVIGRIIPAKDMPFMKNGTKIQVTLNPLGIPSRMNFAQFFVAFLGYSMKLQGKRMILTSFNPDSYKIAEEILKDPQLKPQQLYDGRTCLPFDRTTSVGMIYLKKQTHTARSKVNSCAAPTNFNVVTNQPKKGKSISGGQTTGEMETWTFEALGCRNFLQELFTIKSDSVKGREDLVKCLEEGQLYDGPMENTNIHATQALLRVMCCDLVLEDGKYLVRIMKDEDIRSLSISPIKNTKESLQDDNVFGSTGGPKAVDFVKTRWSYMELGEKIVHPNWIYKSEVPSLVVFKLKKIDKDGELEIKLSTLSRDRIRDIINGKFYMDFVDGVLYGSADATLLETPRIGISTVVRALEETKLETSKIYYNSAKSKLLDSDDLNVNSGKQERLYKINYLLNTIDYLETLGPTLSTFVISSFPVLPKNYRYQMDGRSADFDLFYNRIISAVTSKDADKIYTRILEFTGLDNRHRLSQDSKAKNLAEYFTGKNSDKHHGAIRENINSHVVSFSGRSVIVPGNIKLGYVGLPRQACYNLLRLEIKHELLNSFSLFEDNEEMLDLFIVGMEMGDINRCVNAIQSYTSVDRETIIQLINDCDDKMRELLSNTAVAIGRQPTLHEGSIKGLIPIMVEGHSIHIHTLLCSAFNADFDGDQMWYAMAHTKASIQELLTKAHPSSGVFSSKDGDVNLTPTQDIILGIYLATMLHDNVLDSSLSDKYTFSEVQYYDDLSLILTDVELGNLNNKDLVCYTHSNGMKYLSTAGRIILNSILKHGFTDEPYTNNMNIKFINPDNYRNLKYDGLVKSDSPSNIEEMIHFDTTDRDGNIISKPYMSYGINSIITDEVPKLNPEEILVFFDKLVEYGIESCIRSGITLHLDDFKDNPMKEAYAERYEELIEEWNTLYELGLMTEEERKSLFIRASNYCSERVRKHIMDDYDRNDNLFIIIDSGARGKAAQVMRSTGFIGVVSKSNTEQMETPIMTGYKYGLDSSSVFIMANGTRHGVSTVQKDTGKTGEMTRDAVYMSAGLRVVESDCGCGFVDIDVDYSEPIDTKLDLANKKLSPNSKLFQDTKYITKDGVINTDVLNYIFKNHITDIELDDGSVTVVKYKVSNLFKNMMINKLGSDLNHLENNIVITSKTIDDIEKSQLKTIKARTIIKCESKDGICARCYGVLHNGRKLPPIGYAAGVIAGQSFGEPSTQLVLDTINSNGAGNSGASAIDICKAILSGSDTDRFKYAIVAKQDMNVLVEDSGKQFTLDMLTEKYKVNRADLLVVDGERVKAGQVISRGVVRVKDIPNYIDDFLYARMFKQVETLYYIFFNSNVSVDARHFEVMVKAQLDYVHVYYSDSPEIKEGLIYPYREVKEQIEKGHNIGFYNTPLKKTDRILTVSGPTTALCHHDPFKIMSKMSINPSIQNDKMSFVGALFTGSNLVTFEPSKPVAPKFEKYRSDNIKTKEDNEDNEFLASSIFKVEEMETPSMNIDLSGLFEGIDLKASLLQEEEVALDGEPQDSVGNSYSGFGKSLFFNSDDEEETTSPDVGSELNTSFDKLTEVESRGVITGIDYLESDKTFSTSSFFNNEDVEIELDLEDVGFDEDEEDENSFTSSENYTSDEDSEIDIDLE